jgi:tetratricopeptide (TPR) repeat protein
MVGVNGSIKCSDPEPLKYAERDARDLAQVLERKQCQFAHENVTLLLAEQATAQNVRQGVISKLDTAKTDADLLLFFFSGHALHICTHEGKDDIFFVTHDYDPQVAYNDPTLLFSMTWLWEHLYQSQAAGIVLIVLDCCYAGNMVGAGPDPLVIDIRKCIDEYKENTSGIKGKPHLGRMRIILAASRYNETAKECQEKAHGIMSAYMLAALRGEVPDVLDENGNIWLQMLHRYLEKQMGTPPFIGSLTRPCWLAAYPELSAKAHRQRADEERQRQHAADRRNRLHALLADHRSFIHGRLDNFVGRVQELADLRQRIAEYLPTGGYVIVTGQAGQGKSSIIAKLVEEYVPDTVAHHFVPLNPGPDHQVSLLRNVMARLILKYDLNELFVACESRVALRDFFPRVLREVAAKGGQEVIFLDGLDQIETELTGERDLSFLPTDPPTGIVFVLGTRPDDTLKQLELLKPRNEYPLPNLSRADFDLVLAHRGVTLTPALANRFYQAMQQNALYLDLLAKELREADAVDPEAIIKMLTDNPDHLFTLSMNRLKRHASLWRTILKPVLGVLLVAQQPMSQRALRGIIGSIEDDALRDGLRGLGGLLARDGTGCYYLFHLKLHDFLRQDEQRPDKEYIFATDEEQSWHARLADWCEQGKGGLFAIWQDAKRDAAEQERRTYARQHDITHLYTARERERLFAVLDEGTYGQAKVRWDPSTWSYAQDLDLGRQAAAWDGWGFDEGVAHLPHLWRYSLLRCTLASQADNYSVEMIETMVRVGWEQRAIATVALLTDATKKAHALCKIGQVLWAQTGQEQEARELLLQAAKVARGIEPDEERIRKLQEIAATLSKAGESQAFVIFEEALTSAQVITDYYRRSDMLREIAVSLAQTNDAQAPAIFEKALSTAQAIDLDLQKARMLGGIAVSLAQVGRFEESLTTVNMVEHPFEQALALGKIATALVEASRFEEALSKAQEITDDSLRTETLAKIAVFLAQTNDAQAPAIFEKALSTARAIDLDLQRARTLGEIAVSLAQVERFKESLTAAQEITDDSQRAFILQEIATALAEASRFEEALNTAQEITDDSLRAETFRLLEEIELVLAVEKNIQAPAILEETLTKARGITDDSRRAFILQKIATVLVRVESIQAPAILEESLTTEQAIGLDLEQARALGKIAASLAQAGWLKESLTMAQAIDENNKRGEALEKVATALIQTGQFADALTMIEAITDDSLRAFMLQKIATALAQRGCFEKALTMAQAITDDYRQAKALGLVATELAKAGDIQTPSVIEEALTMAQAITDKHRQEEILGEITVAMAYTGCFEEALTMARAITDDSLRVKMLQEIAAVMAKRKSIQALAVFKETLIMARAIANDSHRMTRLLEIAMVLARTGDTQAISVFYETLVMAQTIDDEYERAKALGNIAKAQAQAGYFKEALITARAIGNEYERAGALREIAVTLAQVEDPQASTIFEEALKSAQATSNRERAFVLQELAVALAQTNRFKDAQEITTQMIEYCKERASALASIAASLAESGEHDWLLRLIQQEWPRATTRDEIIQLLKMAIPLIPHTPAIGIAFSDGFTWVDRFLKGETGVSLQTGGQATATSGKVSTTNGGRQ